jgi:hypothetical protein
VYLRLAGLPTLKVVPCPLVSEVAGAGRGGATALKYFEIEEVAPERERQVAILVVPWRWAIEYPVRLCVLVERPEG